MLDDLLKHEKLGNKKELLFVLFDALTTNNDQTLLNLRKYCVTNVFSIARSFDGLIETLKYISFINIYNDKINLDLKNFNRAAFDKEKYFDEFHFYDHFFTTLQKENVLFELFNENNIKFDSVREQYYVLENLCPLKYFTIRNLLLSTEFLQRKSETPNRLFIKKDFRESFNKYIVNALTEVLVRKKKRSLAQLKDSLIAKEIAGKRAEDFVVQYEKKRLQHHPAFNRIEKISDDDVEAGYDINSFEDDSSVFFDRFIEVKSYETNAIFYWSKNEIETAKNMGAKYYLYLVDRSKILDVNYVPRQIQDPYKRVYENEFWKRDTENTKFIIDTLKET